VNQCSSKIKEVDQLSARSEGDDGALGCKEDSGFIKGLSRTKGSLQLHAISKDDDEGDDDVDDIRH
jgi:hypothetical protein